jgi:hypothetical protein
LDPDTSVGVPGNLHRVLDDMKAAWPEEMRKNLTGNPLLSVIATDLAERDWALTRAQYAQQHAEWLSRLNSVLRERHGDEWWRVLGLPPLWQDEP